MKSREIVKGHTGTEHVDPSKIIPPIPSGGILPKTPNVPMFVDLGKLSWRTGLPCAWLKREAEAGRIPHVKVGRSLMFNLDAVVKALTPASTAASAATTLPG